LPPTDPIEDWTPEFWQDWLEGQVPWRRNLAARQMELALRFMRAGAVEQSLILDAGCGYGRIAERMLQQFPGCRVVVIASSEAMVRAARSRLGVKFAGARSLLESLPFRDGAFDAVLGIGVIMHVADEEAALGELARVLQPGGRLLLSFNSLLSPFSILGVVNTRLIGRGRRRFVARLPRFYLRRLARSGLEVTRSAAATVLCVDPAIAPLRKIGVSFLPQGLLSALSPLDRALSESSLRWFGHEVFLECERRGKRGVSLSFDADLL